MAASTGTIKLDCPACGEHFELTGSIELPAQTDPTSHSLKAVLRLDSEAFQAHVAEAHAA